jgi:hypothetical protein
MYNTGLSLSSQFINRYLFTLMQRNFSNPINKKIVSNGLFLLKNLFFIITWRITGNFFKEAIESGL